MGKVVEFKAKKPQSEDEGIIYVPLDKNGLIVQVVSRAASKRISKRFYDKEYGWRVHELAKLKLSELLELHEHLSFGSPI